LGCTIVFEDFICFDVFFFFKKRTSYEIERGLSSDVCSSDLILNPSRRRRIAAGSGNNVVEVNRMIKQFKEARKMMQQMSKGNYNNIPGMDQMMGGGVKGKKGKMAINRDMKKKKKKKKKKKNKKKDKKKKKKKNKKNKK